MKEIDDDRTLTVRQRDAIKASLSMAMIGEDTAGLKSNPKSLAEVFDAGAADTRKAFLKDKTQENYDATVNAYLKAIGEPFGIDMGAGHT